MVREAVYCVVLRSVRSRVRLWCVRICGSVCCGVLRCAEMCVALCCAWQTSAWGYRPLARAVPPESPSVPPAPRSLVSSITDEGGRREWLTQLQPPVPAAAAARLAGGHGRRTAPAPLRAVPEGTPRARPAVPPPPPPGPDRLPRRGQARGRRERAAPGDLGGVSLRGQRRRG